MSKTLVVLAGPTASGKTRTGIELAKFFGTEIISADSRQIYKETYIGTAVPSPEELNTVKHHFIQEISLNDYYNASMYEKDVIKRAGRLFEKNDVLLMVGGSGLYIDAVCRGIDDLPTVQPEIRDKLAEKYKKEGLYAIQEMLRELDPVTYELVDLNNHFRVLKALEVSVQTGRPYASFLTKPDRKREFDIVRLALNDDRETLYSRINKRALKMIDDGLWEEVGRLQQFRQKNAMKTVGYRELFRHLDGDISLEEAIDLIQRNTRKYARKQITWFRKNNLYEWFKPDEIDLMIKYINKERAK